MSELMQCVTEFVAKSRRWGLPWIGFVVGYVAMAELSRHLSYAGQFSALWLPAGLTVATMSFSTRRRWPMWVAALILSSWIYNGWWQAKPWGVVFGFTLTNLFVAIFPAYLIQNQLPGRFRLNQVRDVLVFLCCACLVTPTFASLIGASTLSLVYGNAFWASYPSWFLGNVAGVLSLAPITLLVMQRFRWPERACECGAPRDRSSWAFYLLLIAALSIVAIGIFRFTALPITFLVAPIMIGLILRHEVFGASTGILIVALVMFASMAKGHGPIAEGQTEAVQLLIAQGFLSTLGITALILASVVQSQRQTMCRIVGTQQHLAALHLETQKILDAVPSIILYEDLKKRILRTNRSASQWLGMAAKQIEGRTLVELCPGLQPLQAAAEMAEEDQAAGSKAEVSEATLSENRSCLGLEQLISLPNGRTQWLLTDRVTIADESGNARRVVTVLTDITDRKKIEAELERSNQDLERYAVVVSHDLKEPLRAVSGYCRFLQEDYGDVLAPEGQRYVEKAIQGADRMTGMIGDLLEYSRVSQTNLKLVPVELNVVVANVCGLLHRAIEESGAVVQIGSLPSVLGSEASLSQLFQNLIANALKFVEEGKTPVVTVSCQCEADHSVVSVSDNGLGIDPNQYKRVFEIFQRLHRHEDYPGSGVGLAICERIMFHHRGKILLESKVGTGSHFRLVFPSISSISPVFADSSYCKTKV